MLITLDATPLLGVRTGIGRYVENLVRALPAAVARRELDASVQVMTWTWRGGRPVLPAGVRQVGPRVPARLLRGAWSRVAFPPVELLVGGTDVVHGTNFVSPPARRAREVVTIHDLTYLHHRDTVAADSLAYATLVRRSLGRGAHVVTPSEAVAALVRDEYGLPADRVTATPLGVDPEWFDAAAATPGWLASRGIPGEYYVFVGSLDPRKNIAGLLRAYGRLRAVRPDVPALVLAGPAGRQMPEGAPAGVHVTGWLADQDLRALLAGATALVLPSLDEGFGLPVVEAFAAGLPVVASAIPALLEVAGGLAVTAPPGDDDALAGALEAVLGSDADEDARAARVARARTFTWAACAERTLDAYGLR